MKTKNTALPSSRVVVDTRGSKTTVALWNGGYMETVNQDGLTEYEYDVLHIETRLRPNLAEIIESNFDVWYNAAEEAEIPAVQPPTLDELATQLLDAQVAIMEMSLE
ncbi:MAG TPA: hypothetical protein PK114_00125 [Smithellaceae bacterium]|nr:hypothetical protein [Smithellaceae bacterium]